MNLVKTIIFRILSVLGFAVLCGVIDRFIKEYVYLVMFDLSFADLDISKSLSILVSDMVSMGNNYLNNYECRFAV